jgi:hypothetical protein
MKPIPADPDPQHCFLSQTRYSFLARIYVTWVIRYNVHDIVVLLISALKKLITD